VQIIKGWLDQNGETHERIYDVAVSDRRTIGEVVAHWIDPDFEPSLRGFYYVRVIEIPTPRWSAYDATFFDIDMREGTRMTVQDRAYTSPIWYTPGGHSK